MIEYLIAYLTVGWLVTVVVEFFAQRSNPLVELYYRRCVILWPVLLLGLLVLLINKMIEWGIDD